MTTNGRSNTGEDVEQRHGASLLSERLGGRKAEATRSTGNSRNATLQIIELHRQSLV